MLPNPKQPGTLKVENFMLEPGAFACIDLRYEFSLSRHLTSMGYLDPNKSTPVENDIAQQIQNEITNFKQLLTAVPHSDQDIQDLNDLEQWVNHYRERDGSVVIPADQVISLIDTLRSLYQPTKVIEPRIEGETTSKLVNLVINRHKPKEREHSESRF